MSNTTFINSLSFNTQTVFENSIQIPLSPVDGYVLTSDSSGNATWAIPGALDLTTLNPINIGTDPTLGGSKVAIGQGSGTSQGDNGIAIGYQAGGTSQGAGAIAIGASSTSGSQFAGSIVINATGSGLGTSAAGFFAAPIRALSVTTGAVPLPMVYDTIANELVASDLPLPTYGVANNLAISFDIIGSGGGTLVWVQPEQGSAYKKVILYCAALVGTASFTFTNPFVNTPAIITDSTAGGIPATAITTLTTTGCTITGTTTTGFIFLEGF